MVEEIETHKKTHTNKIWCKFCKKDVTRCHYMEHLKSHAGTGWTQDLFNRFSVEIVVILGLEYACEQCPKKFISQKSLDEHMARHKQQKPFQCHVCNKAFKLLKR